MWEWPNILIKNGPGARSLTYIIYLHISFSFCSSHLETNDLFSCLSGELRLDFAKWHCTWVFPLSSVWTSAGRLFRVCLYQYGQVLGDYVEYVISVWTSARRICTLRCIDLVVILFIVECYCNWTICYPLYSFNSISPWKAIVLIRLFAYDVRFLWPVSYNWMLCIMY